LRAQKQKNSNVWIWAVTVAPLTVLTIVGCILLKRGKREKQTYDEVDREETIN
jgi:hypothetical protein